jgi:hypothetical protein
MRVGGRRGRKGGGGWKCVRRELLVATCFLGLRGFISIGLRVADENYLISVDFHVADGK